MHDVIASHPKWQAVQEKRQRLAEAKRALQQRVLAARREWQADHAKWDAEHRQAALKGKKLPDPPKEPDLSGEDAALHVLTQEEQRLHDEANRVLREIAPDVEEAARVRFLDLYK